VKILLLTDYYPPDRLGGVGIIAKELKAAYEALGHKVFVLTTGSPRQTDGGENIIRSSPGIFQGALRNNLHALRLIRREEISLVHMHHTTTTFFLLARPFVSSFPFVLNSLQVSYVGEAREVRPVAVNGRIFRPRPRELTEKYLKDPIHVALDWLGYKLSDQVTVVSEENREEILTDFGKTWTGLEPFVIPNATRAFTPLPTGEPDFHDPALEARLAGKTVLVYVGVFRARKRIQNLLLSLSGVVAEFPSTVLHLVGGGRGYENELRILPSALDIENHVEFVGRVPHHRVGYYLELGDIFCLVSSYEGMPMALLEAMRAGKAVLATNCYGMRDLLADGECGILVPVDDIRVTSEALKELVSDPARRHILGQAARERILDRYRWEDIARRYLALVDRSRYRTG